MLHYNRCIYFPPFLDLTHIIGLNSTLFLFLSIQQLARVSDEPRMLTQITFFVYTFFLLFFSSIKAQCTSNDQIKWEQSLTFRLASPPVYKCNLLHSRLRTDIHTTSYWNCDPPIEYPILWWQRAFILLHGVDDISYHAIAIKEKGDIGLGWDYPLLESTLICCGASMQLHKKYFLSHCTIISWSNKHLYRVEITKLYVVSCVMLSFWYLVCSQPIVAWHKIRICIKLCGCYRGCVDCWRAYVCIRHLC